LDDLPYADENLRKEIETIIEKKGTDFIYNELLKVDKINANKNKGNRQRLVRAYEVYKLTGKTMSQLLNIKPKKEKKFKHFVLLEDRQKIYNKINERCKKMLSCGMIEETEKVLQMGYDKKSYGLTGIGYRQIVEYLDNKITKDQMIESFSQETRQYAKRQITWFKNQPDINIINVSNKNINLITDEILQYI
jgi:tRNA dimethylallyltransferase